MTLLPTPLGATVRSARPRPIGAGLAAVAFLACHAWLQEADRALPARPAATLVNAMAALDDGPADGLLEEWPPDLAGAAAMFQCAPAVGGDAQASVVVWTDSAYQVMAFASRMEGVPWPAYAAAFGLAPAVRPGWPIQRAGQGHAVQGSGDERFVQLPDMRLACTRTWDD